MPKPAKPAKRSVAVRAKPKKATPATHFNFFGLSRELRDQIYGYCLTDDKSARLTVHLGRAPEDRKNARWRLWVPPLKERRLHAALYVCSQMCHEYQEAMAREVLLVCHVNEVNLGVFNLPAAFRDNLRYIQINVHLYNRLAKLFQQDSEAAIATIVANNVDRLISQLPLVRYCFMSLDSVKALRYKKMKVDLFSLAKQVLRSSVRRQASLSLAAVSGEGAVVFQFEPAQDGNVYDTKCLGGCDGFCAQHVREFGCTCDPASRLGN